MDTFLNEEIKNKNWNNIIEQLIKFLQNTLNNLNLDGYVLGVSGGIDSAVAAVLIQLACPKNLKCYYLDCYNSDLDNQCIDELNKQFHLNVEKINLAKIYDNYLTLYKMENFNHSAKSNLKSRLRMMTLYTYANNYNYLVMGTSNKCEKTLGYFTKFGDGAYDINILGDFNKTEIKILAQHLSIPKIIIERAPTASLYANQTDEVEMGISYNQIDSFLAKQTLPPEIEHKILTIQKANKHKSLPPLSPKLYKF